MIVAIKQPASLEVGDRPGTIRWVYTDHSERQEPSDLCRREDCIKIARIAESIGWGDASELVSYLACWNGTPGEVILDGPLQSFDMGW